MASVGQYLLTIVSAAIVASIAISLTADKGATGKLIKMIAGLFVVITMILPWKTLSFGSITEFWSDISVDASAAVANGEVMTQMHITELIKQQTAAYILDKASTLDLDVQVQVVLSNEDPPVPERIIIQGNVSPYGKKQLTEFIYADLGITEANIIWN